MGMIHKLHRDGRYTGKHGAHLETQAQKGFLSFVLPRRRFSTSSFEHLLLKTHTHTHTHTHTRKIRHALHAHTSLQTDGIFVSVSLSLLPDIMKLGAESHDLQYSAALGPAWGHKLMGMWHSNRACN